MGAEAHYTPRSHTWGFLDARVVFYSDRGKLPYPCTIRMTARRGRRFEGETFVLDQFILKLKRGETPFYRGLRDFIKRLMRSHLPVPRPLRPFFRLLYGIHFGVIYGMRLLLTFFYREPMVRSRCESIGKNFHLALLPDISGHARIRIGDNVNFNGKVGVTSGRTYDEPRLTIGDRVDIGHNSHFIVNREIVIEDDVKIASGCTFMDTNSHPMDAEARAANLPPSREDCKPIRVCRKAWIGQQCFVMKGVTIGEGAIIGAGSVVATDIPPYTAARGNPAIVVSRKSNSTAAAEKTAF